jgi:hypothetical protein
LIINSGIKQLNYLRRYRDPLPLDTLHSSGIITYQYIDGFPKNSFDVR